MAAANATLLIFGVCNATVNKTKFSSSAPTFVFGGSTIHFDYKDSNFQTFVAGLAYAPCIALAILAMISRHRFEERVTAAMRSSRVSRPWLRVVQLMIIAFVLRLGWFWGSATGWLAETSKCKDYCPSVPGHEPDSGYSGIDCAGPVFLTLMNRMGQLTYVCAFAIAISCWVAVSAKPRGAARSGCCGCSFAGSLPPFFAVLCVWLIVITALLLVVSLFTPPPWLPCQVGSQLYQSYIMQVGFLYGILGFFCISPLPVVVTRLTEQRTAISQAIADVTARALEDDEWGAGGEGGAGLGLPLGAVADTLLAGVVSRVATGIVTLQHSAAAAAAVGGEAGFRQRRGGGGEGGWMTPFLSGPSSEQRPRPGRPLIGPRDSELRAALLAPEPQDAEARPGGEEAARIAPAAPRVPLRAAAQAAASSEAAAPPIDAAQARKLSTLRALASSARLGGMVLPLVMAACGACFFLRAVMFLWRPFKALSISKEENPCCGSIFADKLCPGAQFNGPIDQYLYPWAFYDIPDIVSGLLVLAACASWPDVAFVIWQLARIPLDLAAAARAALPRRCRQSRRRGPQLGTAQPVGAAAEQRMMAAAAVASLGVPPAHEGAGAWDWPRFRAALRWAGLPAMRDAGVRVQVASHGDGGDVVNCGAHDRAAAAALAR